MFATQVAFVGYKQHGLQWCASTKETGTDEPLCEVEIMLDIHMFVFLGSLRLKITLFEDRAEPLKIGTECLEVLRVSVSERSSSVALAKRSSSERK
jgi:hypothetical protein